MAVSFSNNTLEISWTEEKADQYIKDNNLQALKREIIKKFPQDTPKQWKYITCATEIRSRFFNAYKGLMGRIKRERAFATEHGYVRSWHGAVRRVPELFFMDKTEDGELKYQSDDNKLYRSQVSTLLNIAANTAIQNFEAVMVMTAIVKIQNWLVETGKKSYIWGSVHDSIDLVVHRDEQTEVLKKLREICTFPYPELQGMPLDIEILVADPMKNEIYKGGSVWKE